MTAKWLKRAEQSPASWALRTARAEDLEAARALMRSCDLPAEGLADQLDERYVVAEREGDLVGVAGVERHGRLGLLRSVAVAPSMRRSGLGAALVGERIAWSRRHGIESLYLLTMNAERYFSRHGFRSLDRDAAPPEIRASSQFTDLCPSSAVLMRYESERSAAPLTAAGGLREAVRDHYARAAREARAGKSACCGASCGAGDPITSGLYEAAELQDLPEEAVRASLGCGNPALLAELREGETVLDLGSGGGIDVLLSARRVGRSGKAYGLDMTDEMLELARENQRQAGVDNVEFLKGEIEALPLPDSSVDVVLSNCVINLSADKGRVLKEAFRVLKPGGRFAVSDIVVRRPVPAEIRRNAELWAGCVAGALEEWTYRDLLRQAGFEDVEVVPTRVYTARDAKAITAKAAPDPETLARLDGAFMSAFVRATKPRK
jgi:ubiquinone/menaquinone biosynthesis C-methylase UbiE/N-acetylglutamate synthase-like GNAT family acetyltransferase